jgi:cysteine desulfurase
MSPAATFDAASGEPLHPAGREAWLAAVEQGWADPARLHREGRRARLLLDTARASVAAVLVARPDEVSFTASGTHAIHLAVLGAAAGRRTSQRGHAPHLVTGAVEHSAVLQACAYVAGGAVTSVPVDRSGRVDIQAYDAALAGVRPATLACLQSANHEVGTLQPVAEVAALATERRVPLLVDAAQTAGRLPTPDGWSLLTASAHKWGGPAGVGVLAVRRGVRWRSPLPDDERERGRVAGFENVPAVVAAAASLEAVTRENAAHDQRLRALVGRLRAELPRRLPDLVLVGDPDRRLPHLVTFSLLYVDGEALVHELDRAGFSVSSGSSCTSSTLTPSHVLEAMGVLSHGNVRVSLSRDVTEGDVERFLQTLPDLVARLRSASGVQGL